MKEKKILIARFVLFFILIVGISACNEAQNITDSSTNTSTSSLTNSDTSKDQSSETSSGESEISVTPITDTTSAVDLISEDYTVSGFSTHIYFHNSENKVLIDYLFFPEGVDFDSQKKTVEISCYQTENISDDDNLSISINLPESGEASECEEGNYVIDLSNASFALDKTKDLVLIFDLEESLDIFKDDFGFVITKTGIQVESTGEYLDLGTDVTLEDIIDSL